MSKKYNSDTGVEYINNQEMSLAELEREKENKTALNVELVGIKNLKMTHNWRIEFDVFEIDNDKVKDLMDMLNKPISMGLIQLDD